MQRRLWQVLLSLGFISASGFGAVPDKIWYVDADSQASNPDGLSWATAFPSLQQALGFANEDNNPETVDHIYVANGTYKPGQARSITFTMRNGVQVYGGFQGAEWPGGAGGEPDLASRPLDSDPHTVDPMEDSVLSGDLNGDDSVTDWLAFWDCYCFNCIPSGCDAFDFDGDGNIQFDDAHMNENSDHIVTFPAETEVGKAVIDGFSIVQGRNDGSTSGFLTDGGPAIKFDSSEGTVRNCTLKHNFSPGGSGGVIYGSEDSIMGGHFVQLVISENLTGHGSFGGKTMTDTLLVNSHVVDNRTSGDGAGLWLQGSPQFTVTIINTVIARNKMKFSGAGGGIAHYSGITLVLSNCTIADNDAGTGGSGGGLFTNPLQSINEPPQGWPELVIENSIFWGNKAGAGQQIFKSFLGDNNVRIQHSNIRQFVAGDIDGDTDDIVFLGSANLGTTAADDPLFVDPTALRSDYSLQASSPSIDAAMIGLIAPDEVDLDGDEDISEPTPWDVARNSRRIDEPTARDCAQAIGACGAWPVPDMGAYEFVSDCNTNGIVDAGEVGDILDLSDTRLYPVSDLVAEVTSRDFGHAVAVSGDWAAVSGPGMFAVSQPAAGVVHIFAFMDGTWKRTQDIPNPNPSSNGGYGSSLSMSGDLLIIGAPLAGDGGAADIYRRTEDTWALELKLADTTTPPPAQDDSFGAAVDIDATSGVAIVGASLMEDEASQGLGVAFIYRWNGVSWVEDTQFSHPGGSTNPQFGARVAIEGNIAVVGAVRADPGGLTNAGEAFVYTYDDATATWSSSATLTASVPSAGALFGGAVDVADGRVVIGAPFADEGAMASVGAAYTFTFDGLAWSQENKLPLPLTAAAGDRFGTSVAIHHSDNIGTNADRGIIVVGSRYEDIVGLGQNSGAAHVYRVVDGDVVHRRTLLSPSGTTNDNAGAAVAVFGDRLLIGAPGDRFDGVAGEGPINLGSAYMTTAQTNDRNSNGIPDDCEALEARPETLLVGAAENANRFVSMSLPPSPEVNFALRLRIVSIHDPAPSNVPAFPAPAVYDLGGAVRWVGQVQDCLDNPVFQTTYKCAPLQCTPYYTDWQTALGGEILYVYGTDIVPDSVYEFEAVDDTCVGLESACSAVSFPLKVRTARWADVAAPFQDRSSESPTQPNVFDVTAVVDGVKHIGVAGEVQTMLRHELIDPVGSNTSVGDVILTVDGAKGLPYMYPITPTCAP